MKKATKHSLNVAKRILPRGKKSDQKRIAIALRMLQIHELKDLKAEIKLLKEQIKKLNEEIWAIKRFPYDD